MEDAPPVPVRRQRGRRAAVTALVALGAILLVLGTLAVWVKRVALETDTWSDVSAEVLEQQPVRTAIATYVADSLATESELVPRLQEALPPALDPLAAAGGVALHQLVERLVLDILDSQRVEELWRNANERAHGSLVALVEGEDSAQLQTDGNQVVLDLRPLLEDVAARTGLQEQLAARPEAGRVVVMDATQLETVRDAADLLQLVAEVLVFVVLALWGLALWLAPDKRKAVRAIALSMLAAGLVLVFVRRALADEILDTLVSDEIVRAAASATWWTATDLLGLANATIIVVGLAGLVGAWLAGSTPSAARARRRVAPVLRSRPMMYGGLLLVVLALVAWGPVPATRSTTMMLILTLLAAAGLEALRRAVLAEDAPPTVDTVPPVPTAGTPTAP